MAELNKVLLIGRLTKDPELRYTAAGMAVTTLRMAVNHTYRTKEEKKEEVLYIDVNVWGKSAEIIKQYSAKGRELFIEGRLQQNEWTDKQGQKRLTYRVNADNFQFLGGDRGKSTQRDPGSEGPPADAYEGGEAAAPRQESAPPAQQEDDLPF